MRIVCGVLFLALGSLACSAQLATSNLLSVSGDAEVKVVPDRVSLLIGVETRSKDLAAANGQNDVLVRQVLAAARKAEIASSDIQTEFIHVNLGYNSNNASVVDYYGVTKQIQILLRDTSKFEGLVQALLQSGANHIYSIEFSTSQLRKYRDQARALAVKAAKEKAADLAAAAGVQLGRASSIYSSSYGGGSSYRFCCGYGYSSSMSQNVSQAVGGDGSEIGAESTVALGKISVSASVNMTFQLQ